MEFDIVLVTLPAYTQNCPSLSLVSLATYLTEKGYQVKALDNSVHFYHKMFPQFTLSNPLASQLHLSPYPLWGISNWVGFNEIINLSTGQALIKSLCPVCSDLYQPIFSEFNQQNHLTRGILDSYASALANLDSNLFGFSLILGNALPSLYVIKKLKARRPESKILIGGPEAFLSYRAQFYAQFSEIDYVIHSSEGEVPLESLLSHLKNEIPIDQVPGICFFKQGRFHTTPSPSPQNLDALPMPNFETVEPPIRIEALSYLDILTSKGCSYHCSFCNEPSIWGSYRSKSPKTIYDEIHHYVSSYGIYNFELNDNSFGSSRNLLNALELLSKAGIRLQWGGNCRINELNSQRLQHYRDLGLDHCYFGIESASPKVLRQMGKPIALSKASTLLKQCKPLQIHNSLYFLVGYPGESPHDFQKTLNFLETGSSFIDNILISVFTLLGGAPIHRSSLLEPIPLNPTILNAYTYRTFDGVTHSDRRERFLKLHEYKNLFLSSVTQN